MRHRSAIGIVAALALGAGIGGVLPQAYAVQPRQTSVVSERPSAGPQIVDGTVYAITQIGDIVLAGGSFHQVESPGNGSPYTRNGLVAYNTRTRTVDTSFAPQFDGTVRTLLPAPGGSVYVGGEFSKVSGVPAKALVRLQLSDGARVPGFTFPTSDGVVDTVKAVGKVLYVGGTFTKLAGQAHGGIATLDADTGAVLGKMASRVAEHHAWTPDRTDGQVKAPVGVDRLDVTPDGTRLVAIGNFTTVDGQPRDQVAMWDLTTTPAVVRTWHPPRYDAACAKGYDSDVRDVDFSPDGSYFVITATGGKKGNSLCDSAGRFETTGSGLDVEPTWISTSGADSLLSVAITGEAVYIGGHMRWLNNPKGGDVPGQGAVPRPGVGAVDPATGLPLAWNPGRHPRGAGTYALYATQDGLWVGSDTNYLGHQPTLKSSKIGFFPLAGGRPAASKAAPALPGTVYVGAPTGGAALTTRGFDGTSTTTTGSASFGSDVSQLRGTTVIGDTLFYGKADGKLYERTRSGGSFVEEHLVDPYNDPYWSTLKNGSGPPIAPAGQTYRGVLPNFYTDAGRSSGQTGELASLTSMFYDGDSGRLYYTLSGKAGLFFRTFSPDLTRPGTAGGVTTGGVIHPVRSTVAGVSMPAVTGAFLTGGYLYFVQGSDGTLNKVAFQAGKPAMATAVVVGKGVDWRSKALFLGPSAVGQGPTAVAQVTCTGMTCAGDGSGSSSPSGAIAGYSWSWGDGTTTAGQASSHTYSVAGNYTVTLAVTDSSGSTSTTLPATPRAAAGTPTAAFTSTCDAAGCSFDSSPSTGNITGRSWDFGDGVTSTEAAPRHAYSASGAYHVTLIVTDAQARTDTVSHAITVPQSTSSVLFRASGLPITGTSAVVDVPLPDGVQAGDALILALSSASGGTPADPAGWDRVVTGTNGTFLATTVWQRVATGSEAATVRVTLAVRAKYVAQVQAYGGTAATSPVSAQQVGTEVKTGLQHAAPDATTPNPGSWVLSYWVDKSADTSADGTDLQPPASLAVRGRLRSGGSMFLTQVMADNAGSSPVGQVPGQTATTDALSRANAVTLVVAPAAP